MLTQPTEKLSNIVRSAQATEQPRTTQTTPTPWDTPNPRQNGAQSRTDYPDPRAVQQQQQQQQLQAQQQQQQQREREIEEERQRAERMGAASRQQQHARNDSGATGVASSADYTDGRRHDYDVQSMETSLSSPRAMLRNPIPPPTVTVRSEFPTINRSRQQQSLTCLITVEVVEGKWRPDPEDMKVVQPLPPLASTDNLLRQNSPAPSRLLNGRNYENQAALDEVTEDLHARVDNWHGLNFSRFGKLRMHGHVRVGKDRQSWQELECYLFSEMLICVKEKKMLQPPNWDGAESSKPKSKCTLKGSILIKKHLKQVECYPDENILTLSLSVLELPSFHLQYQDRSQLDSWRRALLEITVGPPPPPIRSSEYDQDTSGTDEDDYNRSKKRASSVTSSYGAGRSHATAPTEYTNSRGYPQEPPTPTSIHIPLDIVIVIPVSSSMQGLKITLLRDTLRFLVTSLGQKDRMGLVTFGSSGGGVPLVGMTGKSWHGWSKVLESIRPVGQKSLRADVVEGANVAMDLLMQRKSTNPLSSILLISDSSTADTESVDFVVSRAEAAK